MDHYSQEKNENVSLLCVHVKQMIQIINIDS